jgi:hypothetical protein
MLRRQLSDMSTILSKLPPKQVQETLSHLQHQFGCLHTLPFATLPARLSRAATAFSADLALQMPKAVHKLQWDTTEANHTTQYVDRIQR